MVPVLFSGTETVCGEVKLGAPFIGGGLPPPPPPPIPSPQPAIVSAAAAGNRIDRRAAFTPRFMALGSLYREQRSFSGRNARNAHLLHRILMIIADTMTEPNTMTYGQYLALAPLLSAQHPISDHHDEMLFIIIHQTKELWLKQMVHELEPALGLVRRDKLIEVHKNLSRVSRIQAVMTLSWDILSTLTPADYLTFRGVLGTSSGFQSAQFRTVEFLLGLKEAGHLKHHAEGSEPYRMVAEAAARPSLWDEAIAALARGGFSLPKEVLERDWSEPYRPSEAVEAAWA